MAPRGGRLRRYPGAPRRGGRCPGILSGDSGSTDVWVVGFGEGWTIRMGMLGCSGI